MGYGVNFIAFLTNDWGIFKITKNNPMVRHGVLRKVSIFVSCINVSRSVCSGLIRPYLRL